MKKFICDICKIEVQELISGSWSHLSMPDAELDLCMICATKLKDFIIKNSIS